MSKYLIGITEAGDSGLDFSWEYKLDSVDGAVLITKGLSDKFSALAVKYKDKIIIHHTVTGYGGTRFEPNVPDFKSQVEENKKLIDKGFPIEKVVIRVDPIFPSDIGVKVASKVIETFINIGYRRFRVSIVDMYPHVRSRFISNGINPIYGGRFGPSDKEVSKVSSALIKFSDSYGLSGLTFEACSEPRLDGVVHCGCISSADLKLFGLDDNCFNGYQRPACMCYDGKVELLKNKRRCSHGCLYCYWRD